MKNFSLTCCRRCKISQKRWDLGISQLSGSDQARGQLGWRQSRKAHPQSYLQPQNLPIPFPGMYSGGPWGIMVLGQTSLQHLKNGPFPFSCAKQTLIYWGFLSRLPTSQIYRISVPVKAEWFYNTPIPAVALGKYSVFGWFRKFGDMFITFVLHRQRREEQL